MEPHDVYRFPSPDRADRHGIVCVGANLSPGVLLSAYRQGIFPWFSAGDPIIWWSPDPRFVLFADELHVPRSLARVMRSRRFVVTFNQQFDAVIAACADVPRPGQPGTWITGSMVAAYRRLHRLGFAHSVEVWLNGDLVGGLYGVRFGAVFCGESMFALEPNASKVGFVTCVHHLQSQGCGLIDSQIYTEHLARFGARSVARADYLHLLGALADNNDAPAGGVGGPPSSVLEGATPDEFAQD